MIARIDRDPQTEGPRVTGLSGRGFRVGETFRDGGLILTPDAALEWNAETLEAAGLEVILALDPPPEFLLLGTGARLVRPPAPFAAVFDARGIGIEPMDSRAAARAWGVLRAEGRWIAAALLPTDA